MAAYARQAKDSELIQYATEIKVRAERRCGELLASTERAPAGRPGNVSKAATDSPPTLADMGLTRDESSRYQQLAAMPAEHFETAVATAKATAGEVTTAFMLRDAKAEALVSRQAVNSAVNTSSPVSDREVIDANAARIAQVRGEHCGSGTNFFVRPHPGRPRAGIRRALPRVSFL